MMISEPEGGFSTAAEARFHESEAITCMVSSGKYRTDLLYMGLESVLRLPNYCLVLEFNITVRNSRLASSPDYDPENQGIESYSV